MQSLRQIFDSRTKFSGKYSKHEFQVFGYDLAEKLNDLPHKSLYIKLAREESRLLLEKALTVVKDSKPKNKARLFMWALKKLRQESLSDGGVGRKEKKEAPEQEENRLF